MLEKRFFLILMISPLSNCLGRCSSTHENKRWECTNLNDFSGGGVDNIEALQIKNSSFVNLASDTFYQFISLKAAVLQDDNIGAIAERVFKGLSSLILLDLARNELEELHARAFRGADFLKVLILTKNRIRYLHEQTFDGLNGLIYLDLSRNDISHIPKGLLKFLPSIKYLDLSSNPLKIARPGRFLESTSLAVLRVSLHGSQEISQEFFADLPNLQVLDLSGSDLKVWPAQILYPLPKLRVLYIDKPFFVNEDTFIPRTVEKFVQTGMKVNSEDVSNKILQDLEELNKTSKSIDVLQYIDDFIYEDVEESSNFGNLSHLRIIQKFLLFSLLAYLSFMYIMCIAQIFKALAQNPYQKVYLDEL